MKKIILIVDDESQFREVLTRHLNKEGYETITANNGEEAFALLGKEDIDLVLLDILMPRSDGIDFIKKVHESNYKGLPIIVLSNLSEVSPSEAVKEILIKSNTSLEQISQKIKKHLS
jgi:DNA-binding response OmpR family regulator